MSSGGYFVQFPFGKEVKMRPTQVKVLPEIQAKVRQGIPECASLHWWKIEELLQRLHDGATVEQLRPEAQSLLAGCGNLERQFIVPFLSTQLNSQLE